MKKPLAIPAYVFGFVGLLGFVFKIQHYPGAMILLSVGTGGLALLAWIWFFLKKRNFYDFVILLFIVSFTGSVLLNIMDWPGGIFLFDASVVTGLLWATLTLARK